MVRLRFEGGEDINKRRSKAAADVGLPHIWIQGPMRLATIPATSFLRDVNSINFVHVNQMSKLYFTVLFAHPLIFRDLVHKNVENSHAVFCIQFIL